MLRVRVGVTGGYPVGVDELREVGAHDSKVHGSAQERSKVCDRSSIFCDKKSQQRFRAGLDALRGRHQGDMIFSEVFLSFGVDHRLSHPRLSCDAEGGRIAVKPVW